jgi:ferredoxin, 2Fe-2S
MPIITYIQHDGVHREVDLPNGDSIMEGAVRDMIPGIDADCGGQCICATCHVFVDPAWIDKANALSPASDKERDMLNFVDASASNSRLACQIRMQDDLEGLVVHMPAGQH